jgi:hypothetical protein
MGAAMINPLFSTVKLSVEGVTKVGYLREDFSRLLEDIESVLPGNSREISIMRTKLEEASFYAVKALRNYKENQA